jgi:serine/threonine protein phosphatase PrpC
MKQNVFYTQGNYAKALISVFMEFDDLMDTEDGEKELRQLTIDNGMQPFTDGKVADSVGCTANVVMIIGNKIVVANAGDSRSALSRNGKVIALSRDHKPDDEKEAERIANSGGKVENGRINNHLNLSRCIGDLHYKHNLELPKNKQTVISEPDIFETELVKEDEFILIGCDGIWERYENNSQDLVSLIRNQRYQGKKPEDVLSALLDSLLAKDTKKEQLGCDNMSCVLIEFNKLML